MLRPSPNHGTQRLPNDDDMFLGRFYIVLLLETIGYVSILRLTICALWLHMQVCWNFTDLYGFNRSV